MARLAVTVEAVVTYTCFLDEEDSARVKELAEEYDLELEEAVRWLYRSNELNLYKNSVESDFATDEIVQVEEEDAE
jgi:hypothetical protein